MKKQTLILGVHDTELGGIADILVSLKNISEGHVAAEEQPLWSAIQHALAHCGNPTQWVIEWEGQFNQGDTMLSLTYWSP